MFNELAAPMRAIQQPRLFQSINSNMLGNDGLPAPELLQSIDGLICELEVLQAFAWTVPDDLPHGSDPSDRWILVSSLQKAIRRGDVQKAMEAAHAAFDLDPRYLLRRLVVCAVEDVGVANLKATAATIALAGNVRCRKLIGERKCLVWLAAELARGGKDRTACNLCTIVDFDRSLFPTMELWKSLPDEHLASFASDLSLPIQRRMLAAWLLAGTKQFWNLNVPTDNDRPRWALMRLMILSRMPLLLYWLADRAAMRGAGCMFVSFLPIWQALWTDEDREPIFCRTALPADPGLNGLLACAFDMHTRAGKRAIARFANEQPIAETLNRLPHTVDRFSVLANVVFSVEGGLLDYRLQHPDFDAVHARADDLALSYYGADDATTRAALKRVVAAKLTTLHRLRAGH